MDDELVMGATGELTWQASQLTAIQAADREEAIFCTRLVLLFASSMLVHFEDMKASILI